MNPTASEGVEAKVKDTQPHIVALDIGTTTLRSHVYTKDGCIKGSSSKRVKEHLQCNCVQFLFHPSLLWPQNASLRLSVSQWWVRDICLGNSPWLRGCGRLVFDWLIYHWQDLFLINNYVSHDFRQFIRSSYFVLSVMLLWLLNSTIISSNNSRIINLCMHGACCMDISFMCIQLFVPRAQPHLVMRISVFPRRIPLTTNRKHLYIPADYRGV